MSDPADPVLERRNRIAHGVSLALRIGGGLYLAAAALFFLAVATSFSRNLTTVISLCLLLGSVVLAPAMVLHYAVKAANRADREGSW